MKTQTQVDNSTYQSVRFGELITKLEGHRIPDSNVSQETVNGVTTETRTVKVSPALAESLLLSNKKNRPVSKANFNKLATAMTKGEWLFDGTPITFDNDGNLLNGQHRLMAVIKSDTTQVFKVATGYLPEVFAIMDNGKTRTGADALAISGFDNHKILAKAAYFVFKFVSVGVSSHSSYKNLSNPELIKFVESEPFLIDSVDFYNDIKSLQNMKFLSPDTIAGMHFLLGKKDAFEAKLFLKKLVTGEDLKSNSPIFILRNRLVDNKVNKRKMGKDEIIKLIISAWNKFRANETVSRLVTPRNTPKIK